MSKPHVAQQGECLESIAQAHGFFWETLWNHPENAKLKEQRQEPHALLAGDTVFIPDLKATWFTCETGQRHRFRVKGVPSELNLVIKNDDKPRAHEPYVLEVDGERFHGQTDGEGRIKHSIPPEASRGKLVVGEGEKKEEFVLSLGHLDPVDTLSGIKARLRNLGFACALDGDELDLGTEQAIKDFQSAYDLEVTGQPDEATRNKLKSAHGV